MPGFCECLGRFTAIQKIRISAEDLEHHGATKSAVAMRVRADRRLRRRPAVRGRRSDFGRRCVGWTACPAGHAHLSPAGTEAGMTDATTPGARILVVDDNDDNRYTLTLYLELEGYADIQIAEDGEQAIARLDKESFDVVLLDVMMPKVDGYQVLSWLKDQRRLHDLPVIMISALNEMTSVVRCIELGAVDYLLKPFNQVLLKARLGASLEKKRLRDQVNAHLFRLEQELEAARDLQMSMLPQVFPRRRGTVRWTYGAWSIPRGKSVATSMISSPPRTDRSVSLSATSPAKGCPRRCSWRVRKASSASPPS